jgi:hypothetical protein
MELGPIQGKSTYGPLTFEETKSVLVQKIEKIAQSLKSETTTPQTLREHIFTLSTLKNEALPFTEIWEGIFPKVEQEALTKLSAYTSMQGTEVPTGVGSANPVVFLTEQTFVPREELQKAVAPKKEEIENLTCPNELKMNSQTQKLTKHPSLQDEGAQNLVKNALNRIPRRDFKKGFNREQVREAATAEAKEAIADFPEKETEIKGYHSTLMKALDVLEEPISQKMGQNLIDLAEREPSALDEGALRYEVKETIQQIEKQLTPEQRREFSPFLAQAEIKHGKHFSKKDRDTFLQEMETALKVTYDVNLTTKINGTPLVNVSTLYLKYQTNPTIKMALEEIPGFEPKKDPLMVAKGGQETRREALMIKMGDRLGVSDAILPKEVIDEANIKVGNETITTGNISPFVEGIQDHSVFELYRETWTRDETKLTEARQNLKGALTPESYGLALYRSLILMGTDDHENQETVVDGSLKHMDLGRNFPPGRLLKMGDDQHDILLRCWLFDFPNLDEPLPDSVVSVVKQNTEQHIKDELQEFTISEFQNPHMTLFILNRLESEEKPNPRYQNFLMNSTNSQSRESIEKLFDSKTPIEKRQTILENLKEKAEKGKNLPRSQASEALRLNGMYNGPKSTEKDREMYRSALNITEEEGAHIPYSQERREQLNEQASILRMNSVTDKMVNSIAKRNQAVVDHIEKHGSITGRELFKTLYPEEYVFFEAREKLGQVSPGRQSGPVLGNVETLIEECKKHNEENPNDQIDVEKLEEALSRLKEFSVSTEEFFL